MSRDSSRTHIHMHASRLADLFEEFSTPPSTLNNGAFGRTNMNSHAPITALYYSNSSTSHVASGNTTHIPPEDIFIPPQHLPLNPEDEDDVVPDQHAAFGITRAMAAREGRERAWRDFDSLANLVKGTNLSNGASGAGVATRLADIGGGGRIGGAASTSREGISSQI